MGDVEFPSSDSPHVRVDERFYQRKPDGMDESMTHQSRTILRGRDAVCAYLGGMNIQTVKKLVQLGMPVKTDCGNWYAHADNLEEWFKNWTRTSAGEIENEQTKED